MSRPIDPSSASAPRLVDFTASEAVTPKGAGPNPGSNPAGDTFEVPVDPPPIYLENAPAPSAPPAQPSTPAQTLPPAAPPVKEPAANPLTQSPPPPPPPGDSKLPPIPNPHPYAERTPGGVIVGVKGTF